MSNHYAQLQEEHRVWRNLNFPDEADGKLLHRQLLGMVEELGELDDCAVAPKTKTEAGEMIVVMHSGEATHVSRTHAMADCMADFVIFCAGYCNDNDYNLASLM